MFDIPLYLYKGGYPLPRPAGHYDYVLAAQGLIKRLETAHAAADLLLWPIAERLYGLNLHPYPLEPLRFKLPRIPEQLLLDTLADARRELGLEVMYQFRLTPTGWQVIRPQQEQHRAYVGYQNADTTDITFDLHSHHTMPAYFSPTDDRDEQEARFYGVMGRLDLSNPQLALRLGFYGHWLANVPALTLFEGIGPFVETYIDEETAPPPEATPGWLERLLPWRAR
jgi:PRTRC genetic system protein A